MKYSKPQIRETQKTPKRMNIKNKKQSKQTKNSPSHIHIQTGTHFSVNHIQTAENQWQRENSEGQTKMGGKRHVTYWVKKTWIIADCLS